MVFVIGLSYFIFSMVGYDLFLEVVNLDSVLFGLWMMMVLFLGVMFGFVILFMWNFLFGEEK